MLSLIHSILLSFCSLAHAPPTFTCPHLPRCLHSPHQLMFIKSVSLYFTVSLGLCTICAVFGSPCLLKVLLFRFELQQYFLFSLKFDFLFEDPNVCLNFLGLTTQNVAQNANTFNNMRVSKLSQKVEGFSFPLHEEYMPCSSASGTSTCS